MKIGSRIGDFLMALPGLERPVKRLRSLLRQREDDPITPCSPSYSRWVRACDTPNATEIRRCRARSAAFVWQPAISIVMGVSDVVPAGLAAAIRSVQAQSYPNWELCIADGSMANSGVAAVLRRHAASDPRIKVHDCDTRGHVCPALNTALAMATGDFIAALGQDDLLPPLALHWVAEAINHQPDARVLYSDEDKIDDHGRRHDPHFKSDFNHVLLLTQNLISHLCVYQRDLVVALGGYRDGFDGAQDHDLALRCVAAVSRREIVHIPRILYHRREASGGSPLAAPVRPSATTATRQAVIEHIRQFDEAAAVEPAPESPTQFRIRHSLPTPAPLVSLVICTRDREPLLRTAIESIQAKTTYPHYEIVVLDNGSREAATLDYLSAISARPGVTVIRDDSPFNYSRLNNTAAGHARGELLCLLNNDIEVLTPDWLEEMASFANQPDVGAVGARLWYPDGTLQHGGVILGIGGVANHAHPGIRKGQPGYFGRAVLQQELSAVTGACLMVRRAVFDEVDGLDEELAVAFNDVDFCLRIRAAGYRNIWTPFAELIHHESASRGTEDNPEKLDRFRREIGFMMQRWGTALKNDPYYNPNLSRRSADYAIASRKHSLALRRAA